jgi:cytochrome c oxidase assembly protein subunit 15
MYSKAEVRFIFINFISIVSLFLLILAGGIVRSSGSGMGCPDWPKCFDQYIPPTDISQLPADYKIKYVAEREKKNKKFAQLLDKMGYRDLALKIRNDQSIKVPEEFNPNKTWTEYINRLIGAITGLLLVFTFFRSRIYFKKKPSIFWLSLINLFLVLFQAWLGSIVVSTNLLAWVITLHVLLALVILAISIYTWHKAKFKELSTSLEIIKSKLLYCTSILALIITTFQIAIGTRVRESIDAIIDAFPSLPRNQWILQLGHILNYHRDMAILTLLVNLAVYFLISKFYKKDNVVFNYINGVFILIISQIIVGSILSHLALPPIAQATHILLASLLFGAQFYLVLLIGQKPLVNYKIA